MTTHGHCGACVLNNVYNAARSKTTLFSVQVMQALIGEQKAQSAKVCCTDDCGTSVCTRRSNPVVREHSLKNSFIPITLPVEGDSSLSKSPVKVIGMTCSQDSACEQKASCDFEQRPVAQSIPAVVFRAMIKPLYKVASKARHPKMCRLIILLGMVLVEHVELQHGQVRTALYALPSDCMLFLSCWQQFPLPDFTHLVQLCSYGTETMKSRQQTRTCAATLSYAQSH